MESSVFPKGNYEVKKCRIKGRRGYKSDDSVYALEFKFLDNSNGRSGKDDMVIHPTVIHPTVVYPTVVYPTVWPANSFRPDLRPKYTDSIGFVLYENIETTFATEVQGVLAKIPRYICVPGTNGSNKNLWFVNVN